MSVDETVGRTLWKKPFISERHVVSRETSSSGYVDRRCQSCVHYDDDCTNTQIREYFKLNPDKQLRSAMGGRRVAQYCPYFKSSKEK